MKISFAILILLVLTACGQEATTVRTTTSPSPIASNTEIPGPTSEQGPTASPMPSNSANLSATPPSSIAPTGVPTAVNYSAYGIPSALSLGAPSSASSEASRVPISSSPKTIVPSPTIQPTNKTDGKTAAAALQPTVISSDGIGVARVGMTLGDLKKAVDKNTTFEVVSDFAVDFNAIAVKQQGKVQYYIPYERTQPFGDGDRIRYLVTDNPGFKTAQGVSPGMTIKQVAQIYGSAKLSMNRSAESREIVRFAQQPQEIVFYGARSEQQDLAGIYPESNEEVLETDRYVDRAKIGRITITCREAVCGAEH
jgi:hypothetical protein